MKVRNTGSRPVKVKFGGDPVTIIEIGPNQMAEIPDVHWNELREKKPYSGHLESGRLIEEGSGLDIVPGDGDADCLYCRGRGFVSTDGRRGKRCDCVFKRDVLANVRRVWPGFDLMKAKVLKEPSVLRDLVAENAWITGDTESYRAHLRHVVTRQGPNWFGRVRTDSEMMSGWFAQAKAKAIEIYDIDVNETEALDLDLQDLAEPPELLIMVLGSKRARNVATPEVLEETISIREVLGKPTWIIDQPTYSLEDEAHRCNSPEVLSLLDSFKRVHLDPLSSKSISMRNGNGNGGASMGAAPRVSRPAKGVTSRIVEEDE